MYTMNFNEYLLTNGTPTPSYDPLRGIANYTGGDANWRNIDLWDEGKVYGTPLAGLVKGGGIKDLSIYVQACPTNYNKMWLSYGYNSSVLGYSAAHPELKKISQFKNVSGLGVFCDGHINDGYKQKVEGKPIGSYGIYWWVENRWPRTPSPDPEVVVQGHKKGKFVNVAFLDGHVKTKSVTEKIHYPQPGNKVIWKDE